MPLVEKLKHLVGGSTEEKQYSHACGDCGTEFTSTNHNPNDVSCPNCGSDRTHTAT